MIEKKGIITGFQADIVNTKLTVYAILKFHKDSFAIELPTQAKEFIEEIASKYDMAIPNKDLCLSICDKDNSIAYKFDIFSELLDGYSMKNILGYYQKYEVLKDLISLKPNVNIINLGFTFHKETTNGVKITGIAPAELVNVSTEKLLFSAKEIQEVQRQAEIGVKNGTILEVVEDYSNEDWNGPQHYGTYRIYNGECEEKSEYDLMIKDFGVYENQKLIYAPNTIIHLVGNGDNHLEAHFQLENRELLKGIIGLSSGIASEMETILNIQTEEPS